MIEFNRPRKFVAAINSNDPVLINGVEELMKHIAGNEVGFLATYASLSTEDIHHYIVIMIGEPHNSILITLFPLSGQQVTKELAKDLICEELWTIIQMCWKGWYPDQVLNSEAIISIQNCIFKHIEVS